MLTSIPVVLTLGVTIVATAFLSGIFGMAGGLILLGVCLVLMDVGPAMILHGVTQTAANGWRAVLWRQHIVWPIIWRFLAAAILVVIAMRFIAFVPHKAMVYIGLGLLPFATEVLPQRLAPDILKPGGPWICGVIVITLHLMVGAAGNIVDVFFQNSSLDRRQIVATKSATQTIGHVCRVVYFGSLASSLSDEIPSWTYAGAVVLAVAGTSLAGQALERMTDAEFRRWSRLLILSVGVVFLARGLWLLVGS